MISNGSMIDYECSPKFYNFITRRQDQYTHTDTSELNSPAALHA